MFQFLLRRPVTSFGLSFAVVILIGAIFLKLPWSTTNDISFLDALFTSTSATCITGLVVRDTGTTFTFFGQIIILILIQLGGLGIMTAAAFVFLLFKKMGIKVGAGFKTLLEEEYISDVKRATKFIVIITFLIEAIGATFLFFHWRGIFFDTGQLAFSSIFHSISAFCNAGLSLFRNNLENFRGDVFTNLIVASLIILGGIGFLVLEDFWKNIISFLKNSTIHTKFAIHTYQKFKLTLHTKVVLISTACIVLLGALLFYVFEKENLFLKEGLNLLYLNPKTREFEKIFDSLSNLSFSPDYKKAVLTNNWEIWILFLEKIYGQPQKEAGEKLFLTRFSEEINQIFWLNSHYLIFNTGNKLKIVEIDDRDRINIIDLAEFKNPKIYFSKKSLYILTSNENLYSLEKLIP